MRKSCFAVLAMAMCLGQECAPTAGPNPQPTAQAPAAQCISDTIPANMTLGQAVPVTITLANSGETTWTSASGYELAAVGDSDMFAPAWQELGEEIAPGEQKTFTLQFTAPTRAGTYITDWRMRRHGGDWFGETISRTIVVSEAPSITQQPASASACAGETVTFAVAAAGSSLSYQWQKDGANLTETPPYSGVTTSRLRISNISLAEIASYRCVVTNTAGSAASNPATLSMRSPTSVTQQPTSQTVCQSDTATFTVAATGQGTLRYQWQKNEADIPDATSATLQLPNSSSADAADYRCLVFSQSGTATSDPASLTVRPTTTITQQPAALTVCTGNTASFTVAGTGAGTLTYQWQKNGTDVPGATSATLQITNCSSSDAADYRCLVAGVCGTATSDPATLTVHAATLITQQPIALTVCQSDPATFTVTATGQGTLTYQWQKNSADISGATSATLQINNASGTDAGNYRCTVSGECGSVTSDSVALVVNTPTAITQHPADQDVCSGTTNTFSVTANGTNLTYQWQKDTVDLTDGGHVSGAATATLQLSPTTAADAGSYRCVVTGACGTGTSQAAALAVKALPAITQQPTSQNVCLGDTASFTVAGSGTAPLTYQWRKDGGNISDGGSISGTQTSTLQIAGIAAANIGAYTCVVTDACTLTATSDPAALAFKPAPVIGVSSPVAVTVEKNSTSADVANQITLSATDADTAAGSLVWSVKTAPTHGTASFIGGITTGANVTVGYTPTLDQINADSIVVQVTDGCSPPVEVTINISIQYCPNALVETFESYANQAAFEVVWHDTNNSPYYFDLTSGNPTGTVIMPSPAANSMGRYYRNMGQKVNGTDAAPMTLTYDLWLDPAGSPNWNGARHVVEIRGYSGGVYGSGSLEAMLVIGLHNASSDTFSTTRFQGRVVNGANWQTLDEGSAPVRSSGWHQMKIQVTTSQVKFYVDNILSETENRPNNYGFDCVVIGSDLTAAGFTCRVDNVRVTCGN